MRARGAIAGLVIAAALAPGCRQATGLDEFELACAPGEPECPVPGPLAVEDCARRSDTNGDGEPPPECTGEIAWLRTTPGNATLTCPEFFGSSEIMAVRTLRAFESFGTWAGSLGSLRGTLGGCIDTCTLDPHAHDGRGEQLVFQPSFACNDSGSWMALARGETRAYAAAAFEQPTGRGVVVSAHRLTDASFASRWAWTPPEAITSFAMAAGERAMVAVGQGDRVLFAEPDNDVHTARFHALPNAHLSSIALTRKGESRTLLLAGQTVAPASDPGPCSLGATSPTAFIAATTVGEGSPTLAKPEVLACAGFPLELDIGLDVGSPSMRIAATPGGRVCWAYLGTSSATSERALRTGCFGMDDPADGWVRQAALGTADGDDVDVAIDPFGHAVVTAVSRRVTPLALWEGTSVKLAAADTPNILVAKLHRDTGRVLWARMLAAPSGNARSPRVAVDDDAGVRLALLTDGQALTGDGLEGVTPVSGQVVHFVGLRP